MWPTNFFDSHGTVPKTLRAPSVAPPPQPGVGSFYVITVDNFSVIITIIIMQVY
jgi:hypothetical protein